MSERRVYLDTSVYLGILLGEGKARPFIQKISGKILCSSILLVLESERNLVRLSREGLLTPSAYQKLIDQLREDCEKFLLREVTFDLCLTGTFPPIRTPRSNDLVHLRTAQWFQNQGGLYSFFTLDVVQKEAAKEFGLPVEG